MNSSVRTRISVVIPTYKRPCALQRCLEALCSQTYPAELFEVIVVNDGGQPLEELLSGITTHFCVRLVNQENTGPGGARNRGAGEASHGFLAFLDDDCVPEPDWLAALDTTFLSMPKKVLAGKIINGISDNPFSSTSQMLSDYVISESKTGEGEYLFAPTSNLAMDKYIFDACGGFHNSFRLAAGEDRDFCERLASMGYRIHVLKNARVHHYNDLNMRSFFRQQYNYGRGAYLFRLRRSRMNGGKITLEKYSYYKELFLHSLAYTFKTKSYSVPFLTLVSQVAVATGFFREFMHGSAP